MVSWFHTVQRGLERVVKATVKDPVLMSRQREHSREPLHGFYSNFRILPTIQIHVWVKHVLLCFLCLIFAHGNIQTSPESSQGTRSHISTDQD